MPIPPAAIGVESAGTIQIGELMNNRAPAAPGFSDHLASFVKEANAEMQNADDIANAFAAGETNNIHETMIAAERAVIAFRMVGTVRNRIMEAYNEVMRMGI